MPLPPCEVDSKFHLCDVSGDMNCPFCSSDRVVEGQNAHAIAVRDTYPVSTGHTLVIPRQHVADITELPSEAYDACFQLVRQTIEILRTENSSDGFNIGVNIGAAAGQTVFHAHIHVIPRYSGDVDKPRGGVRCVIPEKQNY